jgi:hypothetical protein
LRTGSTVFASLSTPTVPQGTAADIFGAPGLDNAISDTGTFPLPIGGLFVPAGATLRMFPVDAGAVIQNIVLTVDT